MTPEARRLQQLAARANRRKHVAIAAQVLAAALAVALVVGQHWDRASGLAAGLVAGAIAWLFLRRRSRDIDALAYARHLDALQPQLEDSTEMLLDDGEAATGLEALQHASVANTFARIDKAGELEHSLPSFAYRRVALVWAIALAAVLLGMLPGGNYDRSAQTAKLNERQTVIERATVRLQPPEYLGVAASETDRLDFATFEDAQVQWRLQLTERSDTVSLLFHDDERLELEADGARGWRSPTWPARSTVYRVLVNGEEIPAGIFRIEAKADEAPRVSVIEPGSSLRVLPAGAATDVRLPLVFDARDDYGIVDAQARITLARGNGEQVRFREQAVPLTFTASDEGRQIHAQHEFDLLELGMEPGDELYLFAQVTDNRSGEANVGSSGTYIVRWPGEEEVEADPVATMAISVLPEFFRSQRQIIIDTERLLDERQVLDDDEFSQRAQTLAADQKLLRLRYGQYLGEEDDSGIGSATVASMAATEEADDDHAQEAEEGHDHAGHEPGAAQEVRSGDAQAAIELYGHFHDRAEQSTLFNPETTSLLKAALGQMWDAELQLRLAEPKSALPFEYAALDFIKQVQQSSRVYLRRTGFRPTPIDEGRRLSGELDDIASDERQDDPSTAGELSRMRGLLTALTGDRAARRSVPTRLGALEPVFSSRAKHDPQWLKTLGAAQRLLRDEQCEDCRQELISALWQQLDDTLAGPTAPPASSHPLTRAYRQQLSSSPQRRNGLVP